MAKNHAGATKGTKSGTINVAPSNTGTTNPVRGAMGGTSGAQKGTPKRVGRP